MVVYKFGSRFVVDPIVNANPVIKNHAYCLAHVPNLVRFGSKPRREIAKDAEVAAALEASLRPFTQAAGYAPNQVFLST